MPKTAAKDLPVDDLSEADLEKLFAETLDEIRALKRRVRGLVAVSDKARKHHPGSKLGPLVPALRPLFKAMLPDPHDDAQMAKTRAKFAELFDVHGDVDAGSDPERFEAALLLRRLRRVEIQQQVADELQSFGRLLADDVLHTSELVLIAGQHALDTVRSIGDDNSKYGAFLTPVFNALRSMTKAAQARAAELRAEKAKAAAAAEATAAEPKKP